MAVLNGKRTLQEHYGYFNDVLNKYMKDAFHPKEVLVFVSFQPAQLTLDATTVAEHTGAMFSDYKYIEVLEQTFNTSNRYNAGGYTDGFHSHIIMREADYKCIEGRLTKYNIVAKRIYDSESLRRYLSKQAGANDLRLLPTLHLPALKCLTNDSLTDNVKLVNKMTVSKRVSRITLIEFRSETRYTVSTNKILAFHQYIDDT